jgi:hypothetical protein
MTYTSNCSGAIVKIVFNLGDLKIIAILQKSHIPDLPMKITFKNKT